MSYISDFIPAGLGFDGTKTFGANDAPILIVLGQSNAYGHGTSGNSASITRSKRMNKTLLTSAGSDLQSLVANTNLWINQTTSGTANLANVSSGLGDQSGTYNVAIEFGKLWNANAVSLGLPDLYTILIGEGSQGMRLGAGATVNHWSPDKSPTDSNAHFWRTREIIKLAISNLRSQGKNPRVIAVHWNQWEAEALDTASAAASLYNFKRIYDGITEAIGETVPWRFYYPRASDYTFPTGTFNKVQAAVRTFVKDTPNIKLVDSFVTTTTPFIGDNIHYTAAVQTAFALDEWNTLVTSAQSVENSKLQTGIEILGQGHRIQGDCTNSTESNRLGIQTNVVNGSTALSVIPNGTSSVSGVVCYNNSDPNNANRLIMLVSGTEGIVRTAANGTGSALPLQLRSESDTGGIDIQTNGGTNVNTTLIVSGNATMSANTSVSGFTELGSDAPAIKTKLYTGTTASTDGGVVSIPHSLTASKILNVSLVVAFDSGSFIQQPWKGVAQLSCSVTIDPSQFRVFNDAGNSDSITNRAFKLYVTYME